jgi:pyruvate/2-oxoglutarate/acetoin dehydrogenase E1 component
LDPIDLYETKLELDNVISKADQVETRKEVDEEVEAAAEKVAAAPWPMPTSYRTAVFAPNSLPEPDKAKAESTRKMSYDEAVRNAISEMMSESEEVFVVGEDVGGRYGGAFGVTRGLAKKFGRQRCLNTPLAESAIIGCAVGSALMGLRPIAEMQFADFLAPAFNALVNNAAKIFWRWGRAVPLVVRLPYGGATGTMNMLLGGGPFHSQCPEAWFVSTPGWKVVAPSNPFDAKGLMTAAIRDDNPVIFLESKGLYGFFRPDLRQDVPLGTSFEVPLGQVSLVRPGDDLTILSYGAMVWTALSAAEKLELEGISAEVIDLRTLVPLDEEAIGRSIARTNRVLIVHEASRRGGFGGELAAVIGDRYFYHLDAPVRRVTAPNTPAPYAPPMEHDFLPKAEQIVTAAVDLLGE